MSFKSLSHLTSLTLGMCHVDFAFEVPYEYYKAASPGQSLFSIAKHAPVNWSNSIQYVCFPFVASKRAVYFLNMCLAKEKCPVHSAVALHDGKECRLVYIRMDVLHVLLFLFHSEKSGTLFLYLEFNIDVQRLWDRSYVLSWHALNQLPTIQHTGLHSDRSNLSVPLSLFGLLGALSTSTRQIIRLFGRSPQVLGESSRGWRCPYASFILDLRTTVIRALQRRAARGLPVLAVFVALAPWTKYRRQVQKCVGSYLGPWFI